MNAVDHLPKTEPPSTRQRVHGMTFADSRAACERKRDQFVRRYQKHYPKAAETLLRDWDRMITFYELPKQHWVRLRTTNIVELPFDMVRLPHQRRTSIQACRECNGNDLEATTCR